MVVYDVASVGAQAYMAVAREILERDRARAEDDGQSLPDDESIIAASEPQ